MNEANNKQKVSRVLSEIVWLVKGSHFKPAEDREEIHFFEANQ